MEELYTKYRDRTFRVAMSVLKKPELAAEANQRCWENLLRRTGSAPLPQGSELEPYLITAARHAALDVLRQEGRCVPLDEDWDAPAPDDAEGASDYRTIVALICSMPEEYRQVLELKFILEYDNRTIAKRTGLSLGAVAGRIRRGRILLIQKLREEGYTDEQTAY